MDPNREFAELLGLPEDEDWMCPVDFVVDPRFVLREMRKREDWPEFAFKEMIFSNSGKCGISLNYILDTTGLLRNKAIEFLKEERS
uniref:Uncharacterized protein n=1 Tax=viral metagenome TaxID=1070528 RepID=A0A6H1ZZ56_9ZZZZ